MSAPKVTARRAKGLGASANQQGFTLIELMISMVLGIVIIGALIVLYINGSTATRNVQAQGQMNEDAQMALAVVTNELRQAGYNPIRPQAAPAGGPPVAPARNDLLQGGWSLFACDTGFADNTVAGALLACNAAGTSTSLAVVYEADRFSGRNTTAAPPLPMDCLGFGVPPTQPAGAFHTMQSRLFIQNGALRCIGGSSLLNPSQVLAENIESMTVAFGVAAAAGNKQQVAGYLTASQIMNPADPGFLALTPLERWNRVLAARVCIVVRSENAVLADLSRGGITPSYSDCTDTAVAINDGRMRRAYRTTVLLRNHGVGF